MRRGHADRCLVLRTCRDEDPTGDWTLKVIDRVNPLTNGTFQAWSLQLWGEAIDASKTTHYSLPVDDDEEEGEDEEPVATTTAAEELPPATTNNDAATKVLPKPTANLPSDHAAAPGYSNKPGLAADPVQTTNDETQPTASESSSDGIATIRSTTWAYSALAFIALAGVAGGSFFFFRNRRRSAGGFGAGDERGQYGILGAREEGLSMGILSRGRRRGQDGAKASELYDAFGAAESEDEYDEADERRGVGYHE